MACFYENVKTVLSAVPAYRQTGHFFWAEATKKGCRFYHSRSEYIIQASESYRLLRAKKTIKPNDGSMVHTKHLFLLY